MIVIDSSALIAILNDEPERTAFNEAIERAGGCLIPTANFVETSIVIDSQQGLVRHEERRLEPCYSPELSHLGYWGSGSIRAELYGSVFHACHPLT
jgi:uncharacterized protein with PIN domain